MMVKLFAALVLLVAAGSSSVVSDRDDSSEAVLAMHLSIEKPKLLRADEGSSLCYEYIGCFDKESTAMKHVSALAEPPEKIGTQFLLYTRQTRAVPRSLTYTKPESFLHVDRKKDVLVLVHGFGGIKEYLATALDTLLEVENDNVIFVSWENGAQLPWYPNAAVNSELVGRQLGVLLQQLMHMTDISPKDIHIIGFSLGAHVAGFAGKFLRKMGKTLGRITGLDPASPLFERYGPEVHLSPEDADYVDVIHTSAGTNVLFGDVGMEKPIGHVDFYPNGGTRQPGCGFFSLACSHQRSVYLYAASVKNCTFPSRPCAFGYEGYTSGRCDDCGSEGCGLMGHHSHKAKGRGMQFLTTPGEPPFCGSKK